MQLVTYEEIGDSYRHPLRHAGDVTYGSGSAPLSTVHPDWRGAGGEVLLTSTKLRQRAVRA